MAELTAEQKQAVSQWADQGATLNDIQSRLKSEFGLSMTYMEARLLVTELGVSLKDPKAKTESKAAEDESTSAQQPGDEDWPDAGAEDESAAEEAVPTADGAAGEGAGFSIEADELVVPGALVSGTARFSDGVQAKWYLDQLGRLSLKADSPGYQPPPADVPKFQQGLEKILVKMGMY